ncbi:MAG: MFS transporter [Faecousia sp.]
MGKPTETDRIWNRSYCVLFTLNAVNSLSFYFMFASVLLYAKQSLGWDAARIGLFGGVYAIAALVCRPVGGFLSDRYGARLPMLVGSILMTLSALFYGLSQSFFAWILTRMLHGVAFSLSNTSMTSAVASALPKRRMGEGIGYYGLAIIHAQSVAPGLGLTMASRLGFDMVFYTSAILAGICAAGVAFLVPDTPHPPVNPGRKKGVGDLVAVECLGLAAVGATVSATNGIFSTYLVLSAGEWGIPETALSPFYWVNGITLVLTRFLIGKISKRLSSLQILTASLLLCMASAVVMLRCRTLGVLCIVAALKGLGSGIGIPTQQAACFQWVSPERNGVASSTYYIGADVGNGLGPMIAGQAVSMSSIGYDQAYLVNLGILAAGMLGLWRLSRKKIRME